MKSPIARFLPAGKALLLLLAAALCTAGCGQGGGSDGIPYRKAEHYFLRNDVDARKVPVQITTQDGFDRHFGMATVMGGQPTAIDFARQFVIAIVLPATDHSTEIHPGTLADAGTALELGYSVSVAPEKNTWTQVPLCLLVVDRQYDRGNVILAGKE